MKQQEQPPGLVQDFRSNLNAVLWAVYIGSMMYLPLLRSGFGEVAIGWMTLAAGAAIAVIASEARSHELLTYWYVWIGFSIWNRLRADRGADSEYQGWPWLAQLLTLRLVKDEMTLRRLEPFICMGAAYLTGGVLGKFFLAGFFILTLKAGIERQALRKRVRAMRDARRRMQQQAEMMRDL